MSVSSRVAVFLLLILSEKPSGEYRTQVLYEDTEHKCRHTEKKSEMHAGLADIFIFKANSKGEMIQ